MASPEKSCLKAVNFDLDTKQLKSLYLNNRSLSYLKAYKQIGTFLKSRGFVHRQWSGYISRDKLSHMDIYNIITDLDKTFPWLSKCVTKFDVTDIGEQHDLMYIFQKSSKEKLHAKSEKSKEKALISRDKIKKNASIISQQEKTQHKDINKLR